MNVCIIEQIIVIQSYHDGNNNITFLICITTYCALVTVIPHGFLFVCSLLAMLFPGETPPITHIIVHGASHKCLEA